MINTFMIDEMNIHDLKMAQLKAERRYRKSGNPQYRKEYNALSTQIERKEKEWKK